MSAQKRSFTTRQARQENSHPAAPSSSTLTLSPALASNKEPEASHSTSSNSSTETHRSSEDSAKHGSSRRHEITAQLSPALAPEADSQEVWTVLGAGATITKEMKLTATVEEATLGHPLYKGPEKGFDTLVVACESTLKCTEQYPPEYGMRPLE